MKEINQIIHITKCKKVLKSILENGFYTSYARENLGNQIVLIPMISFSNILFRDIGENEVVDYGRYGIVFDRDFIIEKFELNPVFYVKKDSEIDQIFSYNFQTSIVPQTLHAAKIFHKGTNDKKGKFTDHVGFEPPLNDEVKNLFDTIDQNVNDEFINSIRSIFEKYFVNTLKQILLLKPYKVQNKIGEDKIAYNEREWRKSFSELHYISEYTPKGELNDKFIKWSDTPKPHYTDKYILKFDLSDIKCLYVENDDDVVELKQFIQDNFQDTVDVYTLDELKENETNGLYSK